MSWVRVMADYAATGLWDKEGVNISVDTVPISRALAFELGAWQSHYDLLADGPEWDERRKQHHAKWGLRIAQWVKEELPEWTVIYFDESKLRLGHDQPRDEFEYEVKA